MKKTRYAIAQVSDKQYLSFKTNNDGDSTDHPQS